MPDTIQSPSTVQEALANAAARWPNRPAIYDAQGMVRYADLQRQVDTVARQLREHGCDAGDRLGVMAVNSREFIIAAFAGLRCGATVLPLSHQLRSAEIADLLASVPLRAIVHDGSGQPPLPGPARPVGARHMRQLAWIDVSANGSSTFARFAPDVAFIRHTSGTTGTAKGVAITHRGVLERTAAANRGLRLSSEDVIVWVLPMAFHFFVSIVLYLRYGAAIAICPAPYAQTILATSNAYGGALLYASPLHYRLLAADPSGDKFQTLRRAISTSTGLPRRTAEAFLQRYGLPVTQAYGIIEVGLPIINLDSAREHPESVGHPLQDFQVALLGEDLQPIDEGNRGQLALRGPGMFAGYVHPPTPREEVLHNGWFCTGDIAERSSDGRITIVGRCKTVINVAGNKVFPEEVEGVLNAHPGVRASRVSGHQHEQMGCVVRAEVVLAGNPAPTTEELIRWCRNRLSGYKAPARVDFVDALPRTRSGKIRRHG